MVFKCFLALVLCISFSKIEAMEPDRPYLVEDSPPRNPHIQKIRACLAGIKEEFEPYGDLLIHGKDPRADVICQEVINLLINPYRPDANPLAYLEKLRSYAKTNPFAAYLFLKKLDMTYVGIDVNTGAFGLNKIDPFTLTNTCLGEDSHFLDQIKRIHPVLSDWVDALKAQIAMAAYEKMTQSTAFENPRQVEDAYKKIALLRGKILDALMTLSQEECALARASLKKLLTQEVKNGKEASSRSATLTEKLEAFKKALLEKGGMDPSYAQQQLEAMVKVFMQAVERGDDAKKRLEALEKLKKIAFFENKKKWMKFKDSQEAREKEVTESNNFKLFDMHMAFGREESPTYQEGWNQEIFHYLKNGVPVKFVENGVVKEETLLSGRKILEISESYCWKVMMECAVEDSVVAQNEIIKVLERKSEIKYSSHAEECLNQFIQKSDKDERLKGLNPVNRLRAFLIFQTLCRK